MKYQVGDLVRVRRDLVVEQSYGTFLYSPNFAQEMSKYRGGVYTVKAIEKRGDTARVTLDGGNPMSEFWSISFWNWSLEMLQDVNED